MLRILQEEIIGCRLCPRLCDYTAKIAETKRRAYFDWDYWGRPVPSFGDPHARVMILGLAPGAHGSNRTGLDQHVVDEWVQIVAAARLAEGFDGKYAEWLVSVAEGSTLLRTF